MHLFLLFDGDPMKKSKRKQIHSATTKSIAAASLNDSAVSVKVPMTDTDLTQAVLEEHLPASVRSLQTVHTIVTSTAGLAIQNDGLVTPSLQEVTAAAGKWGGLVFGILNFIQTPILYIYSRIKNKENPITPSGAATFAYTTTSLVLTVLALLVPAVAPTLGLIGVFIGGIAALTHLFNLIHNYNEAKYLNPLINEKIDEKKEMIAELKAKLTDKSIELERSPIKRIRVLEEIGQELRKNQKELEALISEKKANDKTITDFKNGAMDKSIGLLLACVTIVGAIVSLVFPPAGMIIAGVAALTGAVYGAVRLSQHFYRKYQSLNASNNTANPDSPREENYDELDSTHHMLHLFENRDDNTDESTSILSRSDTSLELERDESAYSSANDSVESSEESMSISSSASFL